MARSRRSLRTLSIAAEGPNSPVYLMQVRLQQMLRRMRSTVPFPVPIETFLSTVYPVQVMREQTETPWRNLLACVNNAELAHFSVEGRGENETFWVRHPVVTVPAPPDPSKTLTFAAENPHFQEVSAWLDAALETQFEMTSMGETVATFIRTAKHPRHVESYWPELFAFVAGVENRMTKDPIPKINTRALELPVPRAREEIITMLAKCSLLPEVRIMAWVQYPRED